MTWSLAAAAPRRFSLIVFYRGLHCPICKTYIAELDKVVPEFAAHGVETIALSCDTEARANQAYTSWALSQAAGGPLAGDRNGTCVGLVYFDRARNVLCRRRRTVPVQ